VAGIDFADIVDKAMPAVVSVRSAKLPGQGDEEREQPEDEREMSPEDFFWRRFFGDPDRREFRPPVPDGPRIGEGSGFLISEDGYLLTNNHVVEEADNIRVGLQNGREYTATVIGTDPSIDLALLKVDPKDDKLPVLPLGDSEALRVGEWVIAIGNPLEFEQTVTVGVLSAKDRRVPIGNTDTGVVSFLQTDAAINFGNSGGPLLDSRGNVIGINTAIRRANFAEGIGFALPINHARNVIEQLREHGYVKRGYLGIRMNETGIDETAREWLGLGDGHGVIVDSVNDDGPAHKAGMQPGDVIRKVDGDVVKDNLDLIAKIASRQPGDEVRLEIYRKGDGEKKSRTVSLTAVLEDREEGLAADTGESPFGIPQREDQPQETTAEGLGLTVGALGAEARARLRLPEQVEGVLVKDVAFDSHASDKGIIPDMVVTAIEGRPLRSVADWKQAIAALEPGQAVKVDLRAGPRPITVYLRVPTD
jgi:serine protease Do